MNLDYIAAPVDRALLAKELNKDKFVRFTNKGNNEIYIVNHHNSPNVMREIGRLREVTFASAGGGTGKEIDIDELDTCENCYDQLIVYSREDDEIVSGYRFMDCSKFDNIEDIDVSTAHYFAMSDQFKKDFLPYCLELGRSWVQPNFQPQINPRKGIFALDNLWDGLGALIVDYPHMKYFVGKVTMYTSYNQEARDAILAFMEYYFPDTDKLLVPHHGINPDIESSPINDMINGLEFKEGLKALSKFCKERGEFVPPLINSYMGLSSTMRSFGTAMNPDFGDVEETGIMVTINDIFPAKKDRHVNTYEK